MWRQDITLYKPIFTVNVSFAARNYSRWCVEEIRKIIKEIKVKEKNLRKGGERLGQTSYLSKVKAFKAEYICEYHSNENFIRSLTKILLVYVSDMFIYSSKCFS